MERRLVIVEDQKLTRVMLAMLIEQDSTYRVVASASSAEEAIDLLPGTRPHIVLLDLGLPGMSGIEAIRKMKQIQPDVEILVLTIFDRDESVFESLKAGASGYLLKDSTPEEIISALDLLVKGRGAPMSPVIARRLIQELRKDSGPRDPQVSLSPREREILTLLSKGFAYKEIASHLDVSFGTVQSHIKNLYHKLQVNSKYEAVTKTTGRLPSR